MLGSASELRFVGEASSGTDALVAMDRLLPDLVLMDVHMPVMDGPTTAKALLSKYPAAKIVAWTVSESSDDLLRMMKAGCAGYVLKDVDAIVSRRQGNSDVSRDAGPAGSR
jgi:DNA-binding NarL/FixJ family response regulator